MNTSKFTLAMAVIFFSPLAFASCTDFDNQQDLVSRYQVNQGLVTDTKTNLTWQRCSLGTTWSADNRCKGDIDAMSLSAAKNMAQNLNHGWRVPTINELYSIVEPRCINPSINTAVFPSIIEMDEGAPYWSVSEVEEVPILFYFVDFWDGRADGHSNEFSLAVRLVRD
jgi:hypothetical protein